MEQLNPFIEFPEDAQEWLNERAAILEYDARIPRKQAESEAKMLWLRMQIDEREIE